MKAIILMFAAAIGLSATGCTVHGAVPASATIDAGVAYDPLYYDGRVVYYNDAGLPYYYRGNSVYYIPRTHPRFGYYAGYYHRHAPAYRHWYRSYGPRYRNVYRPSYHHRGHSPRYHSPRYHSPRYHHSPGHHHRRH